MTPSFISPPSPPSHNPISWMNLSYFSSLNLCAARFYREVVANSFNFSFHINFLFHIFIPFFLHTYWFPFSSFLLHFSYIHSIFLSPILISSEYPPRWGEERRRPVRISRAFFCNIRNIYLRTNISSDKYSSSEKYLFWEIFIWRNICFENICFFQLVQNICFPRNIYSEKYLFRKYFFLQVVCTIFCWVLFLQ